MENNPNFKANQIRSMLDLFIEWGIDSNNAKILALYACCGEKISGVFQDVLSGHQESPQ